MYNIEYHFEFKQSLLKNEWLIVITDSAQNLRSVFSSAEFSISAFNI